MKCRPVFFVVLMVAVAVAPAFAQQVMDLAKEGVRLSSEETRQIFDAAELQRGGGMRAMDLTDNFSLPQAPGVVFVLGPNAPSIFNRRTTISAEFRTTQAFSAIQIAYRMVLPSGEKVSLGGFSVNLPENYFFHVDLWDTPFPSAWPSGTSRLEVFFLTGGVLSQAAASFDVNTCCVLYGPNVGGISVALDGMSVFVAGQFSKSAQVDLGVLILGIRTSKVEVGTAGIAVTLLSPLRRGGYAATICDRGECGTRAFYFAPLPPPGKG